MKSTIEILEENGLNWNVVKKPLIYNGEEIATFGVMGVVQKSTPYYGIVREDTGEVFSTVKEGYTPTQNHMIIDTMREIAGDNDLEIVKAMPIHGGRKILIQMAKPNNVIYIGDEATKQYVYAINSHDGTSSLKFGFMNKVIFCSNQFAWLNSNGLRGYIHKQSIQDKVKHLPEILNFDDQDSKVAELHEMSMIPISANEVRYLIDYLTGIDSSISGWADKETTRKLNIRDNLNLCIGKELNRIGHNKWGLFNGVTRYTTHEKSIPGRDNGREESLFTGSGQQMSEKAFNYLKK